MAVGLQEIQTGLTLEITPSIVPAETDRSEALVRLNLRAENSTPGAGVFGQIDVKSQEVQTNVLVPDGATFVIGGLFDDSSITKESGIPGLKDIPILGALFRNSTNSKSLGETIFFITPHLVDERSVLQDDIAVKVGSEDYIRRERRALTNEVNDSANTNAPLSPRPRLMCWRKTNKMNAKSYVQGAVLSFIIGTSMILVLGGVFVDSLRARMIYDPREHGVEDAIRKVAERETIAHAATGNFVAFSNASLEQNNSLLGLPWSTFPVNDFFFDAVELGSGNIRLRALPRPDSVAALSIRA